MNILVIRDKKHKGTSANRMKVEKFMALNFRQSKFANNSFTCINPFILF